MVAGTGLAAAGLALFASFTLIDGNGAKYRPSASVKLKSEHDLESHGAAGAAQWRFDRLKDANGNLDVAEMLRINRLSSQSLNAQRNNSATSVTSANWTNLGPDNIGGRTRALLIDNQDAANNYQHMFAGGVSGGLWESTDGGNNWSRNPGFFSLPEVNLNVASIAQGSDGAIYVGTGEGLYGQNQFNVSGSGAGGFLGGGMYKSTDRGATWTLLTNTEPATSNSSTSVWAAINKIGVDPTNAQRVVAATNKGIRISNDGGQNWTAPAGTLGTAGATDVDFGSDGSLVVCVVGRPHRSTDGGATFTNIGTTPSVGFLTGSLVRVEIGIAPSDPNWIYAFCAASNGTLAGALLTIDGGQNWTTIAGASSAAFDPFGTGQGDYDNVCEVDPNNKNRCVFGGVQIWRWENVTPNPSTQNPPAGQWDRIALEFPNVIQNPYYVHSDKHAVVFHPTTPGTFYVGTDGGVFRTVDDGNFYQPMNRGYVTTQFYSVAHDHFSENRDLAAGGLQDNGTLYINGLGNTAMDAEPIGGGDGGHTEMSFLNPQAIFATVYYGALSRSNNNGGGFADFYTERVTNEPGFGNPFFASFVTPIRLWETLNNPQSKDSVTFINPIRQVLVGAGNGVEDSLLFQLSLAAVSPTSVPAPSFDLGSIMVTAGATDTVFSNNAGVFSGDGTGSVSTNGYITLRFNNAPANNAVIRVFYGVRYNAGSTLNISSQQVPGRSYEWVSNAAIFPHDTVRIQDPINARLVVGTTVSNPSFDGGVYMTKGPLQFASNPEWMKIAGRLSTPSSLTGEIATMTWSNDGDILYVGTAAGSVFRVSNINNVVDSSNGDIENGNTTNPNAVVTCTRIAAFTGRNVTAIDVDPADNGRVVVALGNYAQTQYVYYSSTADTDPAVSNAGSFVSKTGNMITPGTGLGAAPAYSISFDKYNPNRVLVGTERGIIETQNITAGTVSWAWALTGLNENVGVDMIRQQRWDPWHVKNAGCFYIGTHGRGIWRDDSSWQQPTSINEPGAGGSAGATANKDLRVFPNPVVDNASVAFRLTQQGDVTIDLYDLNGRVVMSEQQSNLAAGQQTVRFNAGDLARGTYLIVVSQNNNRIGTGRFIKLDQ